jgi:hypothetical protein
MRVKLGTTGGTEPNTESNLTTGTRLITKPAAIYTGFYEMQLNPENIIGQYRPWMD